MAKNKRNTKYVCTSCGAETPRWMGRCPSCGAWNTMEEVTEAPESAVPTRFVASSGGGAPRRLSDISLSSEKRLVLGLPEVDRPLGGGIVPGSVILWGGEPGIGKSTLVMQICQAAASSGRPILYASGEESEYQIKMRADRLHVEGDKVFVSSGADLSRILDMAKEMKPALLVVDSIQTMYMPESSSPAGSPGQIRDVTASLVRLAKELSIAVLIVGHVTKEGNLAGPRMLEHMVDVVLYLEGDRSYQFRVLRTVKNRFGATSETGLFMMKEDGLHGIADPSRFLLSDKEKDTAGQIVFPSMEGLRPVLTEIQALTVHSVLSIPRRISVGYDLSRLIVLLAVLERKASLSLSHDDVYLNVAGGLRLRETAADLAAALAVASVKRDQPIPSATAAMGEVGLTGEILPVSHIELRLREAAKMSFSHFIIPEGNRKEAERLVKTMTGADAVYVSTLREALAFL